MELTPEVAKAAGLGLDEAGFDSAMAEQRSRGQAASDFQSDAAEHLFAGIDGRTDFLGYDSVAAEGHVIALIVGGERRQRVDAGAAAGLTSTPADVEVVLDRTPFYAEGGGQQGDAGRLVGPGGEIIAGIDGRTDFLGYDSVAAEGRVIALIVGGERRQRVDAGPASAPADVEVVLDRTPFYAEGGGQQGDAGRLAGPDGEIIVRDTQARGDLQSHIGVVAAGSIAVGDPVQAGVDLDRRHGLIRNHTATHLLHAALRGVLGDHVRQAGSLVAAERLRFDYTQPGPPAPGDLAAVQETVNARIRDDIAVGTNEDALRAGAGVGRDGHLRREVRQRCPRRRDLRPRPPRP